MNKPINVNDEKYIKQGDTWLLILDPLKGKNFIDNLERVLSVDEVIRLMPGIAADERHVISVNNEKYFKKAETWYHIIDPVQGMDFIKALDNISGFVEQKERENK